MQGDVATAKKHSGIMTASEIKENSIRALIGIIADGIKRNGGKIKLDPVYNGTAQFHSETVDEHIIEVYDYKHSRGDAKRKSSFGIYYRADGCVDAPIEELGFMQLFEISFQCERK